LYHSLFLALTQSLPKGEKYKEKVFYYIAALLSLWERRFRGEGLSQVRIIT